MPQRPAAQRPLSPHLQIYRPQLTSFMSIMHRISGVALSVGLVFLAWFLVSLSGGVESYAPFLHFMTSPFGQFMLMGWSLALFYHLCSGVRHLFFDMGSLFDIKHAYMAGYAVLISTVVLTAGLWLLVL